MFKFDLLENEKVVNIYRQTEAVLFKPVLVVFVFIYFPWYFLLKYGLAANYSRLLLFWTLLVFLYAGNKYILWLLNSYIITDKRLISVNYTSVFSKKVSESPLDRILNVGFFTRGIWQTLFKFGSVEIQVAGLGEPMVLQNVAEPSKIKDFLWHAHNHYVKPEIKFSHTPEPLQAQSPSIKSQTKIKRII